MKTFVGTLVLLGAVLTSGMAVAQTLPPHRGDRATAEPGGEAGQTRAQVNSSGATVASESLAPATTEVAPAPGSACVPHSTGGGRQSSGTTATPVNGIGGVGGGRFTFRACRIINNSETDSGDTTAPSAPGGELGSETGEARATVNSSGGVIAAEASAPVNGIGGTGGGRMSNRGHSENGETRATANPSGGPIDIESWSWGRIDRVNTVQACAARGGVVVRHEGVQQCRQPAPSRSEGGDALMQVSTTR